MNRITLLQDYDEKRAREALNLLLRDRRNEFRELAASLRIPPTSNDWEVIVLKFCLDFEDCLNLGTGLGGRRCRSGSLRLLHKPPLPGFDRPDQRHHHGNRPEQEHLVGLKNTVRRRIEMQRDDDEGDKPARFQDPVAEKT